ncbi:MAG: hypothetical protein QM778_27615 [Myxococcales bacterium]
MKARRSSALMGFGLLMCSFALGPLSMGHAESSEPSHSETVQARETLRLRMAHDRLAARGLRLQAPALTIGAGVASIVGGAVLVIFSGAGYDPPAGCDGACEGSEFSRARFGAGIGLLTLGAAAVVVGLPMFVVRVARRRRIHTLERLLSERGVDLALAPHFAPREQVGLSARLRF